MNSTFLRQLDKNLEILSKKERLLCVSAYQEMLSDREEEDQEQDPRLNPNEIAAELISTYIDSEKRTDLFTKGYFNKKILLVDLFNLVISYLLATFAYYSLFIMNQKDANLFSYNRIPFIVLLPIGILIYYLFNLYTLKYNSCKRLFYINCLLSNFMIGIVFYGFLYLLELVLYPRFIIVFFILFSTITQFGEKILHLR